MHDSQSAGRTWLLADKTLSSSNSCSCIVGWGGVQGDTSDGFQILSVLPDIGWAFDRAGERFALCVQAQTLTDSLLPHVLILSLVQRQFLISCWSYYCCYCGFSIYLSCFNFFHKMNTSTSFSLSLSFTCPCVYRTKLLPFFFEWLKCDIYRCLPGRWFYISYLF